MTLKRCFGPPVPMDLLEKVVDVVPTKAGKRAVDRNLMPLAGAGGVAGALPFLVSYLYKKVPEMSEVMPEGVFLSAMIGLGCFIIAKMDLTMTGWDWWNKGRR